MKAPRRIPWHLALLIAAITVIVFSTAGIARMMGWGPDSTADSDDIVALDQAAPVPTKRDARGRPRCPECGLIVSIREIRGRDDGFGPAAAPATPAGSGEAMPATAAGSYEITIRMADGSSRVNHDPSPGSWRAGERVIVIGGTHSSRP